MRENSLKSICNSFRYEFIYYITQAYGTEIRHPFGVIYFRDEGNVGFIKISQRHITIENI